MRTILSAFLCSTILLIAGCSTDRPYSADHEKVVKAARGAIRDEARISDEVIKRTDETLPNGVDVTRLKAPYTEYSKVLVTVKSGMKEGPDPLLQAEVTTDEILYTRHKEKEKRLLEVVDLKLRGKRYNNQNLPTKKEAPPIPEPKTGTKN